MAQRRQRTIRNEVSTDGVGFITGADVTLRFLPAPDNHGIVFQRVDLSDRPLVPATHESLSPRQRRTRLAANGTSIELVEHVMSALAGLQVDNCLIEINAPETPGFDGSCLPVVDALLRADFEEQSELKRVLSINTPLSYTAPDGSIIQAKPFGRP